MVGELRSPHGQKKKERERDGASKLALKFPLVFDVAKDKNGISEDKAKVSIEYFLVQMYLVWVPVLEVCSLPLTQLLV